MSTPSAGGLYAVEWHGDVADVRLTCGKANALNGRSLAAIDRALDEVERARGVVLTGYDHFFSAGLDLVELYDLDRPAMDGFMREFDRVMLRVFTFPRPVVAAVSGHAVAGGCILALACDARVATDHGIRIGLNEIRLGVPFPASALEIVRHTVPAALAEAVLYGGELYPPAEALAHGLVTRLTHGDVAVEAQVLCRRWAGEPPGAFATVKASLREPAVRRAEARQEELRREFVEAWFSPDARQRIGEARRRLME